MRGYTTIGQRDIIVHDGGRVEHINRTIYKHKIVSGVFACYQKMHRPVWFDHSDGAYHMNLQDKSRQQAGSVV